jgi:hypothetical protein
MTLKEKFHLWLKTEPNSSRDKVTLREYQLEVIADEYAIGFAEWLNEEYSYYHGDGEYYNHVENKWYKLKELLEIYKKEKGL